MANTFKTCTVSGVSTTSGTPTTIYTVPNATTTVVLGLMLSNKHSGNVSVTVVFLRPQQTAALLRMQMLTW